METTAAKQWLYATLSASTALTGALGGTAIYADIAPQGVAYPYVVYNIQSADTDSNAAGGAVMGVPIVQVKVIEKSHSFGSANVLMNIINPLLKGVAGTVAGFRVRCARIGDIDHIEVTDGVRYNHLGALYRMMVAGTV